MDKKDTPGFWDISGYGPTSFIKTGRWCLTSVWYDEAAYSSRQQYYVCIILSKVDWVAGDT